MIETPFVFPVHDISEPEKIRILIYVGQQLAHIPLSSITNPLEKRIQFLEKQLKIK